MNADNDVSAHRTRSNMKTDRLPNSPGRTTSRDTDSVHPALVAAIDNVYDALEDRD